MVAFAVEDAPNVADVTTAVALIELDQPKIVQEHPKVCEEEPKKAEEAPLTPGKKYAAWASKLIGEGEYRFFVSFISCDRQPNSCLCLCRVVMCSDVTSVRMEAFSSAPTMKGKSWRSSVSPSNTNLRIHRYSSSTSWKNSRDTSTSFELEGTQFIHIAMEYVSYDLYYLVNYLNYGNVRHLFRQLMEGMQHIHSKGIAHRDIKPENLLINEQYVLKISDFGLAERFRTENNNEMLISGYCGSSSYISPEGQKDDPFHAEPHDIFACGVVLLFLLTKNTHWDKADPIEDPRYKKFLSGTMYQHKSWKALQGNMLNLLKRLLKENPLKRATIEEILRSAWMTEEEEKLNWDKLKYGLRSVYATPMPNELQKQEEEKKANGFHHHHYHHHRNGHHKKQHKKAKR
ncbi:hypothetical protein L596_028121 [Steinernema carpocapsae]|uniref:non-specific serine/threonine protein kinase n=1 Tax=Steinernema carpocapsae TaxID=34508 RepID=A0A4U5LXJ3_STECR|nr:hypothetical protein L596_028121 [Steinernema carpocapsae]